MPSYKATFNGWVNDDPKGKKLLVKMPTNSIEITISGDKKDWRACMPTGICFAKSTKVDVKDLKEKVRGLFTTQEREWTEVL